MTDYIIKGGPDCSQWEYTHDEKAARGGIRHMFLMPAVYKNGPSI